MWLRCKNPLLGTKVVVALCSGTVAPMLSVVKTWKWQPHAALVDAWKCGNAVAMSTPMRWCQQLPEFMPTMNDSAKATFQCAVETWKWQHDATLVNAWKRGKEVAKGTQMTAGNVQAPFMKPRMPAESLEKSKPKFIGDDGTYATLCGAVETWKWQPEATLVDAWKRGNVVASAKPQFWMLKPMQPLGVTWKRGNGSRRLHW